MILRTALALALATAAVPAIAGDVTLTAPIAAGSISEGGIDLVTYFVPREDGAYHVVATWLADDAEAPSRLFLRLEDGEGTTFSLPGHMDTVFGFSRSGDAVSVTAHPVEARTASL